MENDLEMWEMAKMCGKWCKYFTKWLKYVGNVLEIWEMAKLFGNGLYKWSRLKYLRNRHKYVENDLISEISLICVVSVLSILETALLCLKWLNNLTLGLNMWEMTYICGKWLKYLRNG